MFLDKHCERTLTNGVCQITNEKVVVNRGDYFVEESGMETWYYEVISIDGDYANLKRIDFESEDIKLVARALLPAEICEGSKLKYEFLQYFIY